MIKIKHIAHSCFLIENDKEKLIIDPHDNTIGYEEIKENVNYIIISHDHYDHNYIENITLTDNVGSFKIAKVNSFHDKEQGKLRGKNTIHIIETDGIKICHLGDLGHVLDNEQINEIGKIDVLLVPTGGTYTLDSSEAVEVAEKLEASIVIPMHYETDKTNFNIEGVDEFINKIEDRYEIIKPNKNEIVYNSDDKNIVYVI